MGPETCRTRVVYSCAAQVRKTPANTGACGVAWGVSGFTCFTDNICITKLTCKRVHITKTIIIRIRLRPSKCPSTIY